MSHFFRRGRTRVVFVVVLALAIVGIIYGWQHWLATDHGSSGADAAGEAAPAEAPPAVVRLSDTELRAAGIEVVTARVRPLQAVRRVPGRIGYNEELYLPVTSPVAGVVRQVKVQPGQAVKRGDLLAVVSSGEVGAARADVLRKQTELKLAERQYQVQREISENTTSLLDLLAQRPPMAAIEREYGGKLLGANRDDILAAYAKLQLAESAANRSGPLAKQGVVSGRIVQERLSDAEVAAVNFRSVCEETRLQIRQELDRAEAAVADARRQLAVSREYLAALACCPQGELEAIPDQQLNDLSVSAPMAGTVTQKNVVPAARVAVADTLFVLADTGSLWVSAELRESDWGTLRGAEGQEIAVETSALPDLKLTARVRFVGAEVSETTRSLPLVAALENPRGLLKPGLFAWVSVPLGPAREVLSIPSSAVLRDEGETFVFLQEAPGTFRRQRVTTGLETPAATEIVAGLRAGQTVVSQGAFTLKSELLLEGES